MKTEENKITFDIDNTKIEQLKLSLSILNLDPDTAFKEWVERLSFQALRKNASKGYRSVRENNAERSNVLLSDTLDNEVVKSRICRWARNKDGFAYKMLKTFFECYNANSNHVVLREEMRRIYTEKYLSDKTYLLTDQFILVFRQMCSNSSRAYGLIFKYINDNGEGIVELHPENKDFIMSMKESF